MTVPIFISLERVCQVQNKLGNVPRSNVWHQFQHFLWGWLLYHLYCIVNHGFIWFGKLWFIFSEGWLQFVLHHGKSLDCTVLKKFLKVHLSISINISFEFELLITENILLTKWNPSASLRQMSKITPFWVTFHSNFSWKWWLSMQNNCL